MRQNYKRKVLPLICLFSCGSLFLTACGGNSGNAANEGSEPIYNIAANIDIPEYIWLTEAKQFAISLSSIGGLRIGSNENNTRTVEIRDVSNCEQKLTINPNVLDLVVGSQQKKVFEIFPSNTNCVHELQFEAAGLKTLKYKVISPASKERVIVKLINEVGNEVKAVNPGDSVRIQFSYPFAEWLNDSSVSFIQTYQVFASTDKIVLGDQGQCSLNLNQQNVLCEVRADISTDIRSGQYFFTFENIGDNFVVELSSDRLSIDVIDTTLKKKMIFHDSIAPIQNLEGDFAGEVSFNQSHLVYPQATKFDRPILIANRGALLMFRPVDQNRNYTYKVFINGFEAKLNTPDEFYTTDQPLYMNGPNLIYSNSTWSIYIPAEYIHGFPKVRIVRSDAKEAQTQTLDISAPMEQVLINIEIGMLTPPKKINTWIQDPARMGIDFFQKTLISKLTISEYEPVFWKKITMPDGKIYTEQSNDTGGVYSGDLRENIGKSLISTGIRMANIGINDTAGSSQESSSRFKQTVVHTSVGKYQNGVVVHGLSGGGGQLTLDSTVGNQFTHELGHDYGLGHYPGGLQSIQSTEAGWGYDSFRKKMLTNLIWTSKGSACIPNYQPCTLPFEGLYQFNTDAMAGGDISGGISLFTQYTPYSAKIIQGELQKRHVLDENSPSVYLLWNKETRMMEQAPHSIYVKPEKIGVAVMTLVGYYDPEGKIQGYIYPPMYGNWGNVFKPSAKKTNCSLNLTTEKGEVISYPLYDKRRSVKEMNKFHINISSEIDYKRVDLECKDGVSEYVLSKVITESKPNLPDPVVISDMGGYAKAALKLKDIDDYFKNDKFYDLEEFEWKLENIYGQLHSYVGEEYIEAGRLYKGHNNRYYQSLKSGILPYPNAQSDAWRYLGTSDNSLIIVDDIVVKLGVETKNFSHEASNSSVYFYIPVDRINVLYSESAVKEDGGWNIGNGYTKIIVKAFNKSDGNFYHVTLRGNKKHYYGKFDKKLNEGLQSGYGAAKIYFDINDNIELPKGSYKVEFYMVAQGWHDGSFQRKLKVEDEFLVN
ncbi:M66 family metalloprotease [Fastidiosibacter lacustris]|uniref:M66 family metalloprotease n=1 Tax=Fastidiosibacter lacustris TaxID=2056695 RepID=UPI000E35145B|nr:M66 family metalloprotease [Fastidiosibacter lacustris]